MVHNYKDIFSKAEISLKKQLGLSESEYQTKYFKLNDLKYSRIPDEEYFTLLKHIVFYSGFKAEIVGKKLQIIDRHLPDFKSVSGFDNQMIDEILQDNEMIKSKRKIKAIIKNANVFIKLIEKHGSFYNYINSFCPDKSSENLMSLKKDLINNFEYIGKITANHFLMVIGLNILKPDLVISRIFFRLGLIEREGMLEKVVLEGRKFAEETGFSIRYIDKVFVTYGQQSKAGICFGEKPKCYLCGIQRYCKYDSKNLKY